jgi:membrane protein
MELTDVRGWLRGEWTVLQRSLKIYSQIDGEQRAAAFAYYVLFALFPLLALLLMFGSSFFGTEQIVRAIGEVLPLDREQQAFLWESVAALERARGGVGVLSAAILIWCSLRFFQALVRGVNRAWHTIEIPWWQMPVKNILMLAILVSALLAGLLIPAVLQAIAGTIRAAEEFIHAYLPDFNFRTASLILDLARYLLGAGVLFYSFSMLYMMAPRKKIRFVEVWVPALLVTVALQACQMAFVNILPRFVNYGIYGTVGGMMLVLMWVYFSGIIIMLGACQCAARCPSPDEAEPGS